MTSEFTTTRISKENNALLNQLRDDLNFNSVNEVISKLIETYKNLNSKTNENTPDKKKEVEYETGNIQQNS